MIIAILIIVTVLIVYIVTLKKIPGQDDQQHEWTKIQNHPEGSWREDNGDGSFRIYNKTGYATIMKEYSGGERYINGHQVSTADDMERWYVMKGLSEGYERRLAEIEQLLKKSNTNNGDALLKEWNDRYQAYRQLCIDHGFWNRVINDRSSFIPTAGQKEKEEEKKNQIAKLHQDWKNRMTENQVIIGYLSNCPRKHAIKNTLINDLSGKDPEKRKNVQAIYRRLISDGVIAEKVNSEGKMETRLVVRRNKETKTVKPLPASSYNPALYAHIRKNDLLKVEYTVNTPENLNRETNTCQFTSKSSGEIYSTSLEKCTCPIYSKGYACKHMLALAIQLGYYNRIDARP